MKMRLYPALGIKQSLPRTERALDRSLLLPMNGPVTDEEIDYISEQILAFYANDGRSPGT